jgi:predicted TIM-barrel fold metal-dependent hydrolase
MGRRIIVDVQNHILPLESMTEALSAGIIDTTVMPPMFRWRGISMSAPRDFTDVELHLQVCREAGITHIMAHQGMLLTVANEVLGMSTVETARRHNETMARIAEPYRDIVFPYGYIKPHDGKAAVKEAERCIDVFGFHGLGVDTSYGTTDRQFLHTPETYEFWEFVSERKVPVYIHPAMLAYGWEFMDRYKLDETVARPNETALSVSLMILSGLFDRFPQVRIILAHMGGSFTMCLPRLQFAHRLGYEGFLGYQKAVNERDPMQYARENIYVDTMGFHPPGIRHAIEVYGIEHVLLGTDYGPIPISPREHIDIILDDMGLSQEEQDKILGQNAVALFDLPDPA